MRERGWQMLIAVLVLAVGGVSISLISASRAAGLAEDARLEADRRWCGVVTALDDAYRESPPQTPVGRQIATSIAQLRADFHCP